MASSEAALIAWLNADSAVLVEAFGSVPEVRPSSFVTVERTGGQQAVLFDSPTLAVQCWAGTRSEAMKLADLVAARLRDGWRQQPYVAACDVHSIYNFPDPDSGQARYPLTVTASLML